MGNETELRMRWIQVIISNYVCIKMIRKNQFGRNFTAMVIIVNEILPHDFRNDWYDVNHICTRLFVVTELFFTRILRGFGGIHAD